MVPVAHCSLTPRRECFVCAARPRSSVPWILVESRGEFVVADAAAGGTRGSSCIASDLR